MQRLGPLTFFIEINHGVVLCPHVDHLKHLQGSPSIGATPTSFSSSAEQDEVVEDDTFLSLTIPK